ncbi:dienelactone hydrolase family protein [Methylacidimicrobium tartarophylax]|uniref:Phosphoribosyl transferase n=1 Tax=Methylacidimicrobium tartarophylax TaxID=1041768 RepID=A0A5E6MBL7_9BACT|nr:alpha/beta hydrolase [Methylacidimicrobium tartarophylax]VVM06608.1 Putative phosphoribosyl transferase [Methylacidimicrobium tartarophylax]
MKNKERRKEEVEVRIEEILLSGTLNVPSDAGGIVLFAHGSGSSRLSPRNQFVAQVLQRNGSGTLLFDLLTPEEEEEDERTAALRFDIEFLAQRLCSATRWLQDYLGEHRPALGYFGSSTGGGAALVAAAREGSEIAAVVSRGGRPDLAGAALARVRSPTLLIVGGADHFVLRLNREALHELRCEKELAVVPGATHLFEEPGTLEEVARLAADWFRRHWSQNHPSLSQS